MTDRNSRSGTCRPLEIQAVVWYPTTRCQAYIVVAEWGGLLNVQSVDILLEQAKQREIEGGESGLLALK